MSELERQLALLRDELAWPPTPDLATAVGARVAAEPARPGPRGWRGWPGALVTSRRAAAGLAAAVALLVIAATLAAAPGVRARIERFLGIGAVRIERVDRLPDTSPSAGLGLGERTTLAAARRIAPVPVPTITALGAPDAVYVDRRASGAGSASLVYLARPGLRFINRQRGSGTRFLLDALLAQAGVDPAAIVGYEHGEFTHAAVAAFIGSGMADVGFGLERPARHFKLDFIPLATERYFAVCRRDALARPEIEQVLAILRSDAFRTEVDALPGYQARNSGAVFPLADILAAAGVDV